MLNNPPFGFGLLRKYVTLVGSLFDDIYIQRKYPAGMNKEDELIKVPISYAPKDMLLARVDADPDLERPYSALLPRMSFEILDVQYDGSRKLPTNNRMARSTTPGVYLRQYVPVPYNIIFQVAIAAKTTEDGAAIIEQILPFFTPDYTPSVILVPETNAIHTTPIVLNSVQLEDKYDGDFKTRKSLNWILRLTLKGYFYGPITTPSIIKFVETNLRDSTRYDTVEDAVGLAKISEEVDVQVTLTANGQPTTNAAASIPYTLVNITDDYGFASYVKNHASDEDYQ